jgi:two-component system, sensor histidine kinase LadS
MFGLLMVRSKPLFLFLLIAAIWFLIITVAPVAEADRLPEGISAGRLAALEDPGADATLDKVLGQSERFVTVLSDSPNYYYTSSAYWFRLPVQNRKTVPVELFLNVKYPLIDYLTLYVVHQGHRREVIHSGDRIAGANRPFPGTSLVFPFHLLPQESVVLYLRARTDAGSMLLPFELLDKEALLAYLLKTRLFNGLILGLFASLFVYNLFLFLMLREKAYFYYVLFLPFGYLSITGLNGFGSGVLYPWTAWPGNEGLIFVAGISFFLVLAFTRAFLRTGEFIAIDRMIKYLMMVSLLLFFSPLVLPIKTAYQFGVLMEFIFPIACASVGIAVWQRGRTEARFYVLGQVASWLGLLALGLLSVRMLPFHLLTFESMSIGLSIDALLLSLALADRIRIMQKARLLAEDTARRNLEERQEELGRVVTERTAELNRALEKAELLATIDPLTAIYNRRGLLDAAGREVKLALRSRRPLSFVMLDIDHFKQVNDQYGHAEGDRILRDLASAVRGDMRITDLFGRVGGEEFLLVLPDTTREAAVQLAERIREHIAGEILVGNPPVPITASLGVAWMTKDRFTLDKLQSAADFALYQAKDKGRNRVETAE